MKYIILRCEDSAGAEERQAALLEGAKVSHLLHLAQGGAAGLVRASGTQPVIDRFQFHRALFGLGPNDPSAAPAQCYAASRDLRSAPGEIIWCADLVTQQDGKIIDPTAGQIPTKESELLIQTLRERLSSETRRWELGEGSRHVFILRSAEPSAQEYPCVRSPEVLMGRSWKRQLPKGAIGETLQGLISQASELLEGHAVNRVRIDLGENPANMIWFWGAASSEPQRTFAQRTKLSGALISSSFPMRGFARCLGLEWKAGPPSLSESALRQLLKSIVTLLKSCDLIYVHLGIGSVDPVERQCAMERIDQLILKPLTEFLPSAGSWRLLAAVDDCVHDVVPVIMIGTGLPQQSVARLDAEHLAQSPLAFDDGGALFSWFTQA